MGNGVAFQDIAFKIWRLLLTRIAQKFENSMTTALRACWLLYYDDGDGMTGVSVKTQAHSKTQAKVVAYIHLFHTGRYLASFYTDPKYR